MWFHRCRRTHILVRYRSANGPGDGDESEMKRTILGLTIVATLSIPALHAQRAARVDGDRLMAVVTTLADPKLEGRATGTPGGLTARAWVVDRFKTIGLQPVSGAYVHPFTY